MSKSEEKEESLFEIARRQRDSSFLEFFPSGSRRGTYISSKSNKIGNFYRFYTNLESPRDFTITVSPLRVVLPYSFYQITQSRNTFSFIFEEATETVHTLTVSEGNYTATQLIDELNLLSDELTFSLNIITGKVSVQRDSGNFFISGSSKILSVLGFNDQLLTTASNIQIAQNCIDVSPRKTVNFYMLNSELSNFLHFATHVNNQRLLCSIPVSNEAFFSTISYEDETVQYDMIQDNHISFFDLLVVDEHGENINFNGAHFVLTLQFSFRPN